MEKGSLVTHCPFCVLLFPNVFHPLGVAEREGSNPTPSSLPAVCTNSAGCSSGAGVVLSDFFFVEMSPGKLSK